MSVNEKMTAIANEVRTLSGATNKLNLDEMASHTKDANTEVDTQEGIVQQIKEALQGKAAGGSAQIGTLSKYVKIIAKPETTTSFVIENPLGGIAKKVSVQRTTNVATSSRKCQKFLADWELGIGVAQYVDTSGSTRYTFTKTEGTVGNSQFKATEGVITLYRYNSANAWDNTAEYEVEIYE